MIASTRPAVNMPMPKGGPLEQRADEIHGAQMLDQPGLHVALQDRREHEQAPDAEDDAWNGGQQLDGRADRALQHLAGNFGQEQGDAEADRYGDEHRDERGNQRAVDRRQRAVFIGDRVPDFPGNEPEPEMRKGPASAPCISEKATPPRISSTSDGGGQSCRAEQRLSQAAACMACLGSMMLHAATCASGLRHTRASAGQGRKWRPLRIAASRRFGDCR